jgi:putative transposase
MVYHVLNRANGREKIFKKPKDYQSFEKIIIEAKEKYPMRILSFCLMPNHWHFVLFPEEGEDLPRFMRWITHTHTQRYHAHYKSIGYGHVYQGRYKSFPVEKDSYFLQLCRYIERNPLRAGLVEKAQDWKWSSLWIRKNGNTKQKNLLSDWPTPAPDNYLKWVNTTQKDEKKKIEKIRLCVKRGRPFGEEKWVNETAENLGLLSTLRSRGRPRKGT